MTPELKTACELVFQEHKSSQKRVNWHKDAFRGRLSFGLAAMAKQTLEAKNIIRTISPAKKTITVLNPAATAAASFEEAEVMIQNKVAVLTTKKSDDKPAYITLRVAGVASADADDTNRSEKKNNKSITTSSEIKWWMKPLFNYVLLPACAIIVGVLITYLLGLLI